MKNRIHVDYHFHPNFIFSIPFHAERKARKIWKAFAKNKLDAVIISEHSYKYPKKSFEIMQGFKPKNAATTLIPGIEILTKEHTEILVFAKSAEYLYSHEELLTPEYLSMNKVIKFIKKDKELYGIVVHPHHPGTTSIVRKHGEDFTKKAIKELGYVEAHNCGYYNPLRMLKRIRIDKIWKNKIKQMELTLNAPKNLTKYAKVITIGSDAHFSWDIGACAEIEGEKSASYDKLFEIITTKTGKPHFKRKSNFKYIVHFPTYFFEWVIKKIKYLHSKERPFRRLKKHIKRFDKQTSVKNTLSVN